MDYHKIVSWIRPGITRGARGRTSGAGNCTTVREQFPDAGDALLTVPLNLTGPESIDAAVERFGRIDVLANNAGTDLIDDYAATAGTTREAATGLNHAKAARSIVEMAAAPEPPLRLQLGADTLRRGR
ncbi:hypothetical protein ACGFNP_47865 [Nonomuraea sp. NPDC049269]|uniref:hypothetical protein n=1 Tax=Nonomuraea sp. NPDC049269 TaxID=3364349 RepID=UPI00371411E9